MATPVYSSTFGTQATGMDLAIELRSTQDLAFVGQKVPLVAQVTHTGITNGRADVSLWLNDKQLGRASADLAGTEPATVQFSVSQESVGVYCYEVRVDPLPGEITPANNSSSYLLRVVDKPVRVLLLEGKPYWDSKFFMRTLAKVPAVELEAVVRLTDGRLFHRTLARGADPAATRPSPSTQPARQESWQTLTSADELLAKSAVLKGYQIIVLGRDTEAFLTDAAVSNLQNWISREGGSLLCYRGPPTAQANDRLARLLPVKWTRGNETRFRLRLTDEGKDLRWLPSEDQDSDRGLLSALPSLATNARLDRTKPLARILASAISSTSAQESPAVIYQRYGSGRVVVIEGAGMWRWAFLAPQYQQQDQVYDSLWHSLLRWTISGVSLLPGQNVALRCESISFGPAESATATLLVREELSKSQLSTVELLRQGKQIKQVAVAASGNAPGMYRVDFGKLAEGHYEARVTGAAADDSAARTAFDVRSVGQEQLNLKARPT